METETSFEEKFFSTTDKQELNELAIQSGLMITDEEARKLRHDFTPSLGEELTPRERKYYLAVCEMSANRPVYLGDIYTSVEHIEPFSKNWQDTVHCVFCRIRKKLGDSSIIRLRGRYLARNYIHRGYKED